MRFLALVTVFTTVLSLGAATLEQLNMNDVVTKSTAIVRGKVTGCTGEMRKTLIYTRCEVAVSETWKGTSVGRTTVYFPGGSVRGLRQTISGTPRLSTGQEYVLFLWAGRSGINQVIGLTQGVFQLRQEGKAGLMAERAASTEQMLSSSGTPVEDQPVRYSAEELKRIVMGILAGATK